MIGERDDYILCDACVHERTPEKTAEMKIYYLDFVRVISGDRYRILSSAYVLSVTPQQGAIRRTETNLESKICQSLMDDVIWIITVKLSDDFKQHHLTFN